MHERTLKLTRQQPAQCYEFWFEPLGWAFCTVCDATGLLSIISDWGNFDHCWLARSFGKVALPLPRPTCQYVEELVADPRGSYFTLSCGHRVTGRTDCWLGDPYACPKPLCTEERHTSWHPPLELPARERTLTEFLAEMDAVDYVVMKMTSTDRRRFEVVDPAATLAEIRSRIVAKRREAIYSYRKADLVADRRAAREAWNEAQRFVDDLAPSGDNFWEVFERHESDLKDYLPQEEPYEVIVKRDTRCIEALSTIILPTLFAHLRSLTAPPAAAEAAA